MHQLSSQWMLTVILIGTWGTIINNSYHRLPQPRVDNNSAICSYCNIKHLLMLAVMTSANLANSKIIFKGIEHNTFRLILLTLSLPNISLQNEYTKIPILLTSCKRYTHIFVTMTMRASMYSTYIVEQRKKRYVSTCLYTCM